MLNRRTIIEYIEAYDARAGKRRAIFPLAWVSALREFVKADDQASIDNQLTEVEINALIAIIDSGGELKWKKNRLSASGELAKTIYDLVNPESRRQILDDMLLLKILEYLRPEEIAKCRQLNKAFKDQLATDAVWRSAFKSHFPYQYHQIKSIQMQGWMDAFRDLRNTEYKGMSGRTQRLFSFAKSSNFEQLEKMKIKRKDLIRKDASGIRLLNAISSRLNQDALNKVFSELIKPSYQMDGAIISDKRLVGGYLYLHWVVSLSQTEALEQLIQADGIQCINAKSDTNRTPLQMAANYGFLPIISTLIDAGTSADDPSYENNETPIYIAAQNGHARAVDVLVESLDKDDILNNIERIIAEPLFIACQQGHLDVVNRLLDIFRKHIADPLNEARKNSINEEIGKLQPIYRAALSSFKNPFKAAIQFGHHKIIQAFTDAYPLMATAKLGDKKLKPIHIAASRGHMKVVQCLLFSKADVNVEYQGKKPIDLAKSKGHDEIVKLLTPGPAGPG